MANTEPLAKTSGSSNLGEALGTDMSVFKAPKTRGELFQAQYQNRMQQAGAEVAAKKSEMDLQLQQAEAKAQSSKDFAQTMHSQEEERARKLKENELPTFKPTQDDAVALGQLFSLIATTGMLLGSSGKMSSLNSMNAMTGMLEGFSKGRADLFKQQKDIYDKEFQKMKALREDIKNDFDRYKELLATDREAADNLKSVLIAKVGQNSVLGKQLELGNLKAAGDTLQGVEKTMTEAERQSFELKKMEKQHEYAKELANLKSRGKIDDAAQELESLGVHIADKKERSSVNNAVGSMAELKSLKQEVQENPALVGRQGQISQFTDRWINSFKTGEAPPQASEADQEALLFAKKYASMLTRYELALAGTARGGSTVSFQTRYNNLLSQNQFDAASLTKLFDDMQTEVARGAMEKSPKLTYDMMDNLSDRLNVRLGDAPAQTPKTQVPEPPKGVPESAQYSPSTNAWWWEDGAGNWQSKGAE